MKNVNFEVKTKATTVLSAVSTEEEIFAVAKDLLKSELESLAPQPLRLRLMGKYLLKMVEIVRISFATQ